MNSSTAHLLLQTCQKLDAKDADRSKSDRMSGMLGTSSESKQMAALLQSAGKLCQKQNLPTRLPWEPPFLKGLKVRTLLYWQSSANLSPNFCTSPSNFCTWDPYTMRPSKSACEIARLPGEDWVAQLALSKEGRNDNQDHGVTIWNRTPKWTSKSVRKQYRLCETPPDKGLKPEPLLVWEGRKIFPTWYHH
jgi:hypothetical protein